MDLDVDDKKYDVGDGSIELATRLVDEARTSKDKLARLLESQRPALMRLASSELDPRLHHRVDAGDVVQQVLMEATEGFPQFRGTCIRSLRAWLHRITKTTIQDLVRRHITSQKRSVASETDVARNAGQQHWIARSVVTPRTRLIAAEKAEKLDSILSALPESQRIAIELRYFDNLSVEEISNRIDRSLTATAGLLKRGLSKLREAAQEDEMLS